MTDRLLSAEVASPTSSEKSGRRSFGSDILAYYREHYEGVTREQLNKRDSSLYNRLCRDGLIDQVPAKYRMIDDALAYYHEHYEGVTRGQLEQRDRRLYQRLCRDGLRDQVPLQDRNK